MARDSRRLQRGAHRVSGLLIRRSSVFGRGAYYARDTCYHDSTASVVGL